MRSAIKRHQMALIGEKNKILKSLTNLQTNTIFEILRSRRIRWYRETILLVNFEKRLINCQLRKRRKRALLDEKAKSLKNHRI